LDFPECEPLEGGLVEKQVIRLYIYQVAKRYKEHGCKGDFHDLTDCLECCELIAFSQSFESSHRELVEVLDVEPDCNHQVEGCNEDEHDEGEMVLGPDLREM
jgi:hypothetical protein